jgi:hypothetical protein
MSSKTRAEQSHDKTLEESFPASDPPARSGITGSEQPDKAHEMGGVEPKPTGTPTSDRHEAETAHHHESGRTPAKK